MKKLTATLCIEARVQSYRALMELKKAYDIARRKDRTAPALQLACINKHWSLQHEIDTDAPMIKQAAAEQDSF